MRLLILRHAETPWTISGQHTGLTEVELTSRGRLTAEAIAPVIASQLEGETPLVLVSPRKRTRDTARLALPGLATEIDDRLREFDYGDYEGLTHDQILERSPGWNIWTDGCPGGESINDVVRRVDSVLKSIADQNHPVVAVTHGHTSRILAARALGLVGGQGSIFDSAPGSLSILATVRGATVLELWNYGVTLTGS
ncbi:MAG: histidine phosphatase family protein [Microthrixaceae bacterium]|nr:histidine phosphatase family protein [Microthrixaceae bacterium]